MNDIVNEKRRLVEKRKKFKPLPIIKALAEEKEASSNLYTILSSHIKSVDEAVAFVIELDVDQPFNEQDKSLLEQIKHVEKCGALALAVDLSNKTDDLDHSLSFIKETTLPTLLYEIVVDEYQIYEAKSLGVSSISLFPGLLELGELQYFLEISRELHIEPWLSIRTKEALEIALKTDASILALHQNFSDKLKHHPNELVEFIDLIKYSRRDTEEPFLIAHERGVQNLKDIDLLKSIGISTFLLPSFILLPPS